MRMEENYYKFSTNKWQVVKIASFCVFKICGIAFMAVLVFGTAGNNKTLDDIKKMVGTIGLSLFDISTQFILNFVTVGSIVGHGLWYLTAHKKVRKPRNFIKAARLFELQFQVSKLCKKLMDISPYFPCKEMAAVARKKGTKFIISIYAITLIMTGFVFVTWILAAEKIFPDISALTKWCFLIFTGGHVFFGFASPIVISAEFIGYFIIRYIAEHFNRWGQMLRIDEGDADHPCQPEMEKGLLCKRQSDNDVDLKDHVDYGLILSEFIDDLNQIFGHLMVNIFLNCSVSAIISSYASTTFIFTNAQCMASLFFSIGFSFLTVLFFIRIYLMTSCGQHLICDMKSAKISLEKYVLRHPEDMGWHQSFKIEILRERLGSGEGVTPMRYFNLSNGAFVAGMGTIFTYIVVLMQFKEAH